MSEYDPEIWSRLRLRPDLPRQRQIADFVRSLVVSGALPAHTRLPGQLALARRWQTDQCTVNKALTVLVAEGLLSREHGLGTFVRPHRVQPTSAAIYLARGNLLERIDFRYLLTTMLQQLLAQSGAVSSIFSDFRPEPELSTPPPELAAALKAGRVNCLICPSSNLHIFDWLEQSDLPQVVAGGIDRPTIVSFDHDQGNDLIFEWAARHRLRSLGYLSGQHFGRTMWRYETSSERFRQRLIDSGLEWREEWLIAPPSALPDTEMEHFGYRAALQLLAQPELPEGLFLYPDPVARGALQALQSASGKRAEHLQLLLPRNRELPYFSARPCAWLEVSIRDYAEAMLAQLQLQFEHRELRRRLVPMTLIDATIS